MVEQNKISFYDPKDLVLGDKRVTLRLAREEDDKYDTFTPGDSFVIDISEDEEIIEGTILGHWKLPFYSIPVETLFGEGYEVDIDPKQDTQEMIGWLLRQEAKRDLKQYYEVEDRTFFHIIVYLPEVNVGEELLQIKGESIRDWNRRVGHRVFSHIQAYNEFSKCDLI
jgi:hypothetical protein